VKAISTSTAAPLAYQRKINRTALCFLFLSVLTSAIGQDLLSELNQSSSKEREPVYQTFKGTRVVNGHSVETKGKGELEFIISHRFGKINSGAYEFFGLDDAYIRIGLEYGVTSRLGIGIGRSSHNKIIDGYLKYQLVRQSKGGGSPVSITVLESIGLQTEMPGVQVDAQGNEIPFKSKLYYSTQVLLARKFSPNFSLQVSPIYVHANRLDQLAENNDQVALGFSGRYKITKGISINAEYFYRLNAVTAPQPDPFNTPVYYDCIALGIDIETGGHVFQLIFSNTQGMVDRTFVGQTDGDFFKGDIHFGFNITRTFQLGKQEK
jgi:hypothetical protein